jgi:hypothetical protein
MRGGVDMKRSIIGSRLLVFTSSIPVLGGQMPRGGGGEKILRAVADARYDVSHDGQQQGADGDDGDVLVKHGEAEGAIGYVGGVK